MTKPSKKRWSTASRRRKKELEAAQLLLRHSFPETAASRAYYAAFHAASALLRLLGEEPHTHRGLLQRFGLHVIRSNIIPQKTAKSLSTLFQARERSNYGIPSFIDAEEAAQLIQMARQLVTTIEAKITELLEE